jgi:cellulose synthase/poly-beta-1,6-N-acetylglucosamine synthase-like glycosyltransferase
MSQKFRGFSPRSGFNRRELLQILRERMNGIRQRNNAEQLAASGSALARMTSMPVVSVIVPAWNVAEFIPAAVRSVFAQPFEDLELIVVNDGSPDPEALEAALSGNRNRPDTRYIVQENRRHRRGRQRSGPERAESRCCAHLCGGSRLTSSNSWCASPTTRRWTWCIAMHD